MKKSHEVLNGLAECFGIPSAKKCILDWLSQTTPIDNLVVLQKESPLQPVEVSASWVYDHLCQTYEIPYGSPFEERRMYEQKYAELLKTQLILSYRPEEKPDHLKTMQELRIANQLPFGAIAGQVISMDMDTLQPISRFLFHAMPSPSYHFDQALALATENPANAVILTTKTVGSGIDEQLIQVALIDFSGTVLVEERLSAQEISTSYDQNERVKSVLCSLVSQLQNRLILTLKGDHSIFTLHQMCNRCGLPLDLSAFSFYYEMELPITPSDLHVYGFGSKHAPMFSLTKEDLNDARILAFYLLSILTPKTPLFKIQQHTKYLFETYTQLRQQTGDMLAPVEGQKWLKCLIRRSEINFNHFSTQECFMLYAKLSHSLQSERKNLTKLNESLTFLERQLGLPD